MMEQQFPVRTQPMHLARLTTLLIMTGLVVAGCTALRGSAPQTREDAVSAGRQIFVANCVACHGEKGDRVPVAPLNVKEFLDMRGDATLVHAISEGKGVMPAWGQLRGGPLTSDQVSAVVAYLNASAGRVSPTILASSGRTIFQQQCARCHGDKGDRIPAVPLSGKGLLDSRTDAQLVDAINNGKGPMPAFRTNAASPLSEDQVQALVSYLRYNAEVAAAEEARQGRDLYIANCLTCHGERGERVPNVALQSPELLRRLGDGKLTSVISDGSGVMPGFGPAKGGTFEAPQVGAMLAYLKSSAGLPADAALVGSERSSGGRNLYLNHCSGCHGEGGDRVSGANLRSREFLDARSDDELQRQISQGNTRGMPAWGEATGGPLSPADIKSLIDYLRGVTETRSTSANAVPAQATPTSTGAPVGDALVANGKDIYTKNCVVCHGDTRDKLPTAKLADADWLQQRGDDALSQAIANGKGLMPSWGKEKGGPLSQDDISALLAFLKQAARGVPASAASSGSPPGRNDEVTLSIDASRGRDLYTKNCISCHGESRDKIPAAKLADAAWLRERGDAALGDSIANGKRAMPAWGEEKGGPIRKDDIAALLAFFKAMAGGE